jgi:hypothetical protein
VGYNVRVTRFAGVLCALALAVAPACSGGDEPSRAAATPKCPAKWRATWQRLADRIQAPVYCPSWLPDPLTGEIGGPSTSINSVDPDRSYLIGFLWKEGPEEIHVNLRGYPGRTAIPRCIDTYSVAGVTRRRSIPCFSDPQPTKEMAGRMITVYAVNRDADQWHVLYAWRRDGTLYTLSEHIAIPFTHRRVVQNLNRMLRGLVLVEPNAPQTS